MCVGNQNTQPAQGGIQGLLAKAPDPLNISHGGGGLDPMNLMGSPATPALTPLPNPPPGMPDSEQMQEISYLTAQKRAQLMSAQGQQSTILTGAQGLTNRRPGAPPSLLAGGG